ncbi:MAG: hypothetical protein RL094_793 [Candidatus Parcubacteria bacterium]|jgi:TfoX/Sxy family transcriptional regulator of competence genes
MASSQEFVDYVIDQIGFEEISFRKMFGEYALYFNSKVIAFICDDTLFAKILPENADIGKDLHRAPAYPGSKDYYSIDESHLEDRAWLRHFIKITESALPLPKKKKKV